MKRKLSILLCGTLAAGMLTACGGKKEMTGSETNAKALAKKKQSLSGTMVMRRLWE